MSGLGGYILNDSQLNMPTWQQRAQAAEAEVERLRAELGRTEDLLGEYMDDRERLRVELDACQAQHMAQQTSSDYELGQQHAHAANDGEVERLRGEVARQDEQYGDRMRQLREANAHAARAQTEVNRLTKELARQAEQITAVRALHRKWPPLEHPTNQDFCKHDGHPWPCTTTAALDYVEGRAS